MNRRDTVLALLALCMPSRPWAQSSARVYRIGFLGVPSAATYISRVEALQKGLRENGYIEGKNTVIEWRWADGKIERLPQLANELVQLNVDLIITHTTISTLAAKKATTTIPIIIAAVGDPVSTGLVQSLARPGGNVTGGTFLQTELTAKRLQLVRETFPKARRVGLLVNPANPSHRVFLEGLAGTGRSLKLELVPFEARSVDELDTAFEAMAAKKMNASLILEDPVTIANARQIADKALRVHLPILGFREIAESGGLISYGVDLNEVWRRTGFFVDRVLKGAKPAELPIERASKFETLVNLKTAKTLGVRIPPSVLQGADRVIE